MDRTLPTIGHWILASLFPTTSQESNVQSEAIIKHLSQRELAARWATKESTLERWRAVGIGPIYLNIQGRVLYRISDIESYEAQSLRKSTSQPLNSTQAVAGAA
jgi:hypothetical protein